MDVSRKQQLSLRWLALCLLIVVLAWPNLVRLTGDLSYLSARWLAQSGNDRGALWLLTQARRLQPDQPNAFALASAIHYRAGELEASVAQLQAGIENGAAYPHPQLLNDLAVRRYEEGDLDGALNLQEQAAANAPNVAVAQFNLGTLYWRAGNAQAAARSFREATRINPGWASPHFSSGRLFLESGDNMAAEEYARQAIAIEPGLAPAYEALIQSLLAQDEGVPALESIALAESLNVNSERLRLYKALALRVAGDMATSQVMLEKVFRWTDDTTLRRRAAVELRSLGQR